MSKLPNIHVNRKECLRLFTAGTLIIRSFSIFLLSFLFSSLSALLGEEDEPLTQ
jgi:hypothetical protein